MHKSGSFLPSSLVLLPELCAFLNFGKQTYIGCTSRRPELFSSDPCSLDLMMIFDIFQIFVPSAPCPFVMCDDWKHQLKRTYFIKWNILPHIGSNFNLFPFTLALPFAFFLRKLKIQITGCLGYLQMGNTKKVSDPQFHYRMTPSTSQVTTQQKFLDFIEWYMKQTRLCKLTWIAEILAFFILS